MVKNVFIGPHNRFIVLADFHAWNLEVQSSSASLKQTPLGPASSTVCHPNRHLASSFFPHQFAHWFYPLQPPATPGLPTAMANDTMLTDDYVAEMMAKEANDASIKYSSMGLEAFRSAKYVDGPRPDPRSRSRTQG